MKPTALCLLMALVPAVSLAGGKGLRQFEPEFVLGGGLGSENTVSDFGLADENATIGGYLAYRLNPLAPLMRHQPDWIEFKPYVGAETYLHAGKNVFEAGLHHQSVIGAGAKLKLPKGPFPNTSLVAEYGTAFLASMVYYPPETVSGGRSYKVGLDVMHDDFNGFEFAYRHTSFEQGSVDHAKGVFQIGMYYTFK